MEDVINTTPHEIVVCGADNATIARYPSDPSAQLRMKTSPMNELAPLNGVVPVVSAPTYVSIDGPVAELLKRTLIVSMPVGEYIRQHRDDAEFESMRVYGPDTGPEGVVRDGSGRIVGTRRLVMYKP